MVFINIFHAIGLVLYPLQASENLYFFQGVYKKTIGTKRVKPYKIITVVDWKKKGLSYRGVVHVACLFWPSLANLRSKKFVSLEMHKWYWREIYHEHPCHKAFCMLFVFSKNLMIFMVIRINVTLWLFQFRKDIFYNTSNWQGSPGGSIQWGDFQNFAPPTTPSPKNLGEQHVRGSMRSSL